jgi:pimeloyl-ACP methyl ester carboxylesterase
MDLYAEVAGEGSTVVLVHAGICDSRMWDPQWEAFPAAHRTVRYDLRGFGRSPLPPQPFSHGRDLVALLEQLRIERATLVGASLGGRVTLEVAVAQPEVVDALVLADAALPGFAWSDQLKAFWAEEDAALERGDLDAAVEANLRMWVDGPRRPPTMVASAVRERVGQMQHRAFELQLPVWEDAEEALLVPDVTRRLSAVRAPTLVVLGEEDVSDFHQIAAQLSREIPSAQHAVIPDAAHLPSLERPAAFNELVLRFLARDRF